MQSPWTFCSLYAVIHYCTWPWYSMPEQFSQWSHMQEMNDVYLIIVLWKWNVHMYRDAQLIISPWIYNKCQITSKGVSDVYVSCCINRAVGSVSCIIAGNSTMCVLLCKTQNFNVEWSCRLLQGVGSNTLNVWVLDHVGSIHTWHLTNANYYTV